MQGRWPDFAVELTKFTQKHNLKLPVQLGDCYKKDMPPEVTELFAVGAYGLTPSPVEGR